MKLILASQSPRRKEILTELGVQFDIIPATRDEIFDNNLEPMDAVKKVAEAKAREIFEKYPDCAVIGADTIVVLNGEILGKPKNDEEEYLMLSKLSGRRHIVWTGYAFLSKDVQIIDAEPSYVEFNALSEETKQAYVKSGLGLDKAGGYGVQDGFGLVKDVCGSYYNVVGFPKEIFEILLKKFGFLK